MLKIASDVTCGLPAISDRTASRRRGSGKPFLPGRSGNPSGRPRRGPGELDLIAACRLKAPEALAVIEDQMASRDDRIRLAAALAVIERGYGKPTHPAALTGGDGGPVQVEGRTDYEALRRSLPDLHELRASLRDSPAD